MGALMAMFSTASENESENAVENQVASDMDLVKDELAGDMDLESELAWPMRNGPKPPSRYQLAMKAAKQAMREKREACAKNQYAPGCPLHGFPRKNVEEVEDELA